MLVCSFEKIVRNRMCVSLPMDVCHGIRHFVTELNIIPHSISQFQERIAHCNYWDHLQEKPYTEESRIVIGT